jgi:hypothetical protein
VLKNNEEQLKSLQKENYKTGIIAMALIFICFFVYGLTVMFWNKSSH